jgi:hypothetical protein
MSKISYSEVHDLVAKYYPMYSEYKQEMIEGLVASIVEDQFGMRPAEAPTGSMTSLREMLVDAQVIVEELHSN